MKDINIDELLERCLCVLVQHPTNEAEIEKGSNVFLSRSGLHKFSIEDRTDLEDIVYIAVIDFTMKIHESNNSALFLFDKIIP